MNFEKKICNYTISFLCKIMIQKYFFDEYNRWRKDVLENKQKAISLKQFNFHEIWIFFFSNTIANNLKKIFDSKWKMFCYYVIIQIQNHAENFFCIFVCFLQMNKFFLLSFHVDLDLKFYTSLDISWESQ